jgi:DNA-binding CsgD family transcriptional regulator
VAPGSPLVLEHRELQPTSLRLYLSYNTVRTHARQVLRKLDACLRKSPE